MRLLDIVQPFLSEDVDVESVLSDIDIRLVLAKIS